MGNFLKLWTVVPVKPLNRAKSRLKDVLSAEQRYELAQMMLRRVLQVVSEVPLVAGTLIISRDTRVLGIARDYGVVTLQETSPSDLNPALMRATELLRIRQAGAVLVLPADLPFITREDVMGLAESAPDAPGVVLSGDQHRDGTNAMLVKPLGLFDYMYGPGSFERHRVAARLAGAEVKIYESRGLQLDIDVPEDLEEYNRRVQAGDYAGVLTPFLPDQSS
jgi:2-phospho-L-lactate/phosphoenolpyruvate guanylyltransferase